MEWMGWTAELGMGNCECTPPFLGMVFERVLCMSSLVEARNDKLRVCCEAGWQMQPPPMP